MIKDTILPDAIKRLYIINVEAAQNQLNLEEQLQTSIMLNNKFGESFKLNQSHNEFKTENPIQNCRNRSYDVRRHVSQSPFSRQQNIVAKFNTCKGSKSRQNMLMPRSTSSKLVLKEFIKDRNVISGLTNPIEIKSEAGLRSSISDFKGKASNISDKDLTKFLDIDKSSFRKSREKLMDPQSAIRSKSIATKRSGVRSYSQTVDMKTTITTKFSKPPIPNSPPKKKVEIDSIRVSPPKRLRMSE